MVLRAILMNQFFRLCRGGSVAASLRTPSLVLPCYSAHGSDQRPRWRAKRKRRGLEPRRSNDSMSCDLPEQTQHVLVRLRRQREGRRGQRLASLQGQQLGADLVGIGERQVVDAGVQVVGS